MPPLFTNAEVGLSFMDEITDFLTAFTVYLPFKSGILFLPVMISVAVNAFVRLCLAIQRIAFPPKGVSVDMG